MTPFDVVKTRLQMQQKSMGSKCYLYCNGLMDHICACPDIEVKPKNHYRGLTVSLNFLKFFLCIYVKCIVFIHCFTSFNYR